jgi:hypothetical protein
MTIAMFQNVSKPGYLPHHGYALLFSCHDLTLVKENHCQNLGHNPGSDIFLLYVNRKRLLSCFDVGVAKKLGLFFS